MISLPPVPLPIEKHHRQLQRNDTARRRRASIPKESDFKELLDLFSRGPNVLFTSKTPAVKAVPNDPDDDKFVACAIALRADIVITGDKDFAAVRKFGRVRILTPARFLSDVTPV